MKNVNDLKHILKYIKGNLHLGLKYKTKSSDKSSNKLLNKIVAYSDSDFAGDPDTRKSTTGYIIMFGGTAISWCSRKQSVIALSSTEAEFIAAAECCRELIYLRSLLEELLQEDITIDQNIDNQSTISLIKNGIQNIKSKHIDVKFRFIHELDKNNFLSVNYCPTENQVADIFTKPLNNVKFNKFRDQILV